MKLLKTLIIAATTFLVSCGNNPIEDFNSAVKLADQNHWKEAKRIVAHVVDQYPTPLTESFYAICLAKTAKIQEAQLLLKRLAQQNPKDSTVQYLCGHTLMASKDYQEAYRYLRKSYDLNNRDEKCLIDLFQVGIQTNKPETIIYFFALKKFPKYKKDPTLLNNIAAYLNRKDKNKSLNFFRYALQSNQSNAITELNLAINYDQLRLFEQAIVHYRNYLDRTSKMSTPPEAMAVSSRIQDLTEFINNK
jgi:tetratricopeptide (TPR) repeat protein